MPKKKDNKELNKNIIPEELVNELADKIFNEGFDPSNLLKPLLGKVINKVLEKEIAFRTNSFKLLCVMAKLCSKSILFIRNFYSF